MWISGVAASEVSLPVTWQGGASSTTCASEETYLLDISLSIQLNVMRLRFSAKL